MQITAKLRSMSWKGLAIQSNRFLSFILGFFQQPKEAVAMDKVKRCGIYARCSTDSQSTEVQVAALKEFSIGQDAHCRILARSQELGSEGKGENTMRRGERVRVPRQPGGEQIWRETENRPRDSFSREKRNRSSHCP
jgi:hypothetical protein